MVLAIGCVHPPGEGMQYDGYFYRADEMNTLAAAVKDKPVLINHDLEREVGTVREAWIGANGQLNVLFELNETFNGYIAHGLIAENVCADLSLGHVATVDRKKHRVVDKTPTEISICVAGAREGTHIHMMQSSVRKAREKKKKYIYQAQKRIEENHHNQQTMSTTTNTADANKQKKTDDENDVNMDKEETTAKPAAAEDAASRNFKQELLDLVTKQQAEVSVLQKKYKEEQKARAAAEKKASKLGEVGKRKRTSVIEGAIKEMVTKLMADKEFCAKLKPQEGELKDLFEGMKDSDDASPLVDLVSCCASQIARNTAELETEYQRSKKLKTDNDTLTARLEGLQQPALATARQRFGGDDSTRPAAAPKAPPSAPPSAASEWTRIGQRMPRGMEPVAKPRDGASVRHPEFWKALTSGGTGVGAGMGYFDEPALVGREYTETQKPRPL